ncbi:hypothetical protein K438DRAFT_1804876 [Mycena galopus ATCC 62051]|nr:hypothetical protein K438DRAFT_1804876 [Mycena galopus ATCC 62051]
MFAKLIPLALLATSLASAFPFPYNEVCGLSVTINLEVDPSTDVIAKPGSTPFRMKNLGTAGYTFVDTLGNIRVDQSDSAGHTGDGMWTTQETSRGSGTYFIRNVGLDVYVAADANGSLFARRNPKGNNPDVFIFTETTRDVYTIQRVGGNLVWEAIYQDRTQHGIVKLNPRFGVGHQEWVFYR